MSKRKIRTTRPIFPVTAKPFTSTRLLFRPFNASDLAFYHALRSQAEVMKWTKRGVVDADLYATWESMQSFLPPRTEETFEFVAEVRNPEMVAAGGGFVGVIGCHIAEPPTVGYMYLQEVWGKGYASEALQEWLGVYWGLERREFVCEVSCGDEVVGEGEDQEETLVEGGEVLVADTQAKNVGSRKVLEKCGFKLSKKWVQEDGMEIVGYVLERPR